APQGNRGGAGFNFNGDVQRPAPQQRPAQQPSRPAGGNNNGNRNPNNNGNRNPNNNNNGNRNNGNNNGNKNNGNKNNGNTINNNGNRNNVNVSGNTVNRTVVNNPVYANNGAWGWNHGAVWAPAPYYWGGGFWGAMAIGATSAAIYGSIVANNTTYTSYQVAPSSPGSTFLSSYQLVQVQCGPPNLVVVYGPQNSVICANPNNSVAAGNYSLNTETLSLTAM
ncbi:MAG: hypothetical protein WB615_05180, partial [Candidatus Tumulicola sp.]